MAETKDEARPTVEGNDETKVFDFRIYLNSQALPYREAGGFGKIWLLPYMTGKDPNDENPPAWVMQSDGRRFAPASKRAAPVLERWEVTQTNRAPHRWGVQRVQPEP